MKILEVKNMTKRFGGLVAVDDLSFKVEAGSIFGLIGPNGAGKTTVFNSITRFYDPEEGEVILRTQDNEIDLLDYKSHQIAGFGLARTFQNVELFGKMSVLDNMLVGAHNNFKTNFLIEGFRLPGFKKNENKAKAKAMEILDFLGLKQLAYQFADSQPYGVQKLLELGRVLMSEPEIILLDEPAAGMNDSETDKLSELLLKIRDEYNLTIFLVEHDMGLVMDICDEIVAINFGKSIMQGTPKEIQASPEVQEAYLGGDDEL
ncbi:MAG: ABC transporter ATP-binding protein [Halarsenatibacteraceae bacterium]